MVEVVDLYSWQLSRSGCLKVVCPCAHTFFIHLEFRQPFLKKLNIPGSYGKKSCSVEQEKPCVVRDISLGGLGITITNENAIQVEDELIVTLKLGAFQLSGINSTIQVRHIDSGMNIGGAFTEASTTKQPEAVTLFLL